MRTTFILISILVFAPLVCLPQASYLEKPNVIFIVLDDLNDYVGFLEGHPQAETPNLDRLANRGMIFTNAYAQVAQCAPSRASMMTGKGPDYTGVYTTGQYVKDDFRANFTAAKGNETVFTLPEILKDSGGYFTIQDNKIFHGRTQNTNTDVDLDELTVDYCNKGKSWSRAVDLTSIDAPQPIAAEEYGASGIDWGVYPDSLEKKSYDYSGVDSALLLLEDYIQNPSDYCDRPLFLALGIFRPHLPLFMPERYWPSNYEPDLYTFPYPIPYNVPANAFPPNGTFLSPQTDPIDEDLIDMPLVGVEGTNMNGIAYFFDGLPDSLMASPPTIASGITTDTRDSIITWAARATVTQAYLAAVKFADHQLGRFMDVLESAPDIYNNTTIVLVSDHGFAMGEKNHWKKQGLWDTDLRVPMIVIDPRYEGGTVCHAPVSLVDLFPTVLELTNTKAPEFPDGTPYLDGCSMVPLLENPDTAWNRPVFSATKWSNSFVPDGGCFNQFSIRDDRFHYIAYKTNGGIGSCDSNLSLIQEELYEVGRLRETDPQEWYNLADDPAYQSVKEHMAQWLPDSGLIWRKMGDVQIVQSSSGCMVSLEDSIQFLAVLYDEFGNVIPSTGWSFDWTAPELGTITDNAIQLVPGSLSTVPAVLELNLIATSPEGYTLHDHVSVVMDAASPAAVSFDTLSSGATLSVLNIDYDGEILSQHWNFGDGYTTEDPFPAPHLYTSPGTYTVEVTVRYGNDALAGTCSTSFSRNFIVDADDIGTTCQAPTIFTTDYTTTNKAKVDWVSPLNANSYLIEYRPLDSFTIAGSPSSASPSRVFNGLNAHEEYWMRVRSVCATDTSDWSYPHRFTTAACDPPRDIYACRDSLNNGQISWRQPLPYLDDAELRYYTIGLPDTFTVSFFDATSGIVPDLEAPEPIACRMKSICPDENGNPTIIGGSSTQIIFDTCSTAIVNPPDGIEEIALLPIEIMPNPANEQILLAAELAAPTEAILEVRNGAGKLIHRASFETAALFRRTIDVTQWASGLYYLYLQAGKQSFSGKVVVE